jgi:hypothetical protein
MLPVPVRRMLPVGAYDDVNQKWDRMAFWELLSVSNKFEHREGKQKQKQKQKRKGQQLPAGTIVLQ